MYLLICLTYRKCTAKIIFEITNRTYEYVKIFAFILVVIIEFNIYFIALLKRFIKIYL